MEELPLILSRYRNGEIALIFVPIGNLDLDEVEQAFQIGHIHNIVSVPAWNDPLPMVPERREDIRSRIISAATESTEIQNLRRCLQPKYQLRKKLPSGALGQVLLATDRQLQRDVCIKVLNRSGLYREFEDGLLKVANATDHTNILTIYGAYLDSNPPHFVRQYVKGDSLRHFLDDHPRPQSAHLTQTFLTTIGNAVCHAHEREVTDLSIKPSNVIITDPGSSGSRSFMMSLNSYREELFLDDDHWRLGSKGVFYLPLEYRRSNRENCDPCKADQYRLGLIAYEMLLGAARFGELAEGLRDPLLKPATWQWPPLDHANCDCPELLRNAVNRMIKVEPDDRFGGIRECLQSVTTDLYVEIARDSYRRMMETEDRQTDLFRSFYVKFLQKYPKARVGFFGQLGELPTVGEVPVGWVRQFQLLKEAVLLLLVFNALQEERQEPNILTRIAEEHAKRGIPGMLYSGFVEVLIECIVDKDQLPDSLDKQQLRHAWVTVTQPGIAYMKRKTEEYVVHQWSQRG